MLWRQASRMLSAPTMAQLCGCSVKKNAPNHVWSHLLWCCSLVLLAGSALGTQVDIKARMQDYHGGSLQRTSTRGCVSKELPESFPSSIVCNVPSQLRLKGGANPPVVLDTQMNLFNDSHIPYRLSVADSFEPRHRLISAVFTPATC